MNAKTELTTTIDFNAFRKKHLNGTYPKDLKTLPYWLVFQLQWNDKKGKFDKLPLCIDGKARRGKQGSEADLDRLVTFEDAYSALEKNSHFHGLGFALLDCHDIICIDIDSNCSPEHAEYIQTNAMSYTEKSVSGKGVHIWAKRKGINTFKDNNLGIEVFSSSQFVAMTGDIVGDYGTDVELLSDSLVDWLEETIRPTQTEIQHTLKPIVRATNTTDRPKDTYEQAREALGYIPADQYNDWVSIALALNNEFGQHGFELFNEWSSKGQGYKPEETRKKYLEQCSKPTSIKIASLFHAAQNFGYKIQATQQWIDEQTLIHFVDLDQSTGEQKIKPPRKEAIKICEDFLTIVRGVLDLAEDTDPQSICAEYEINPYIIDRFISETIRDSRNGQRFLVLNKGENLNNHTKREAWSHLVAVYGKPYNAEKLEKAIAELVCEKWTKPNEQQAELEERLAKLGTLRNSIYWHIEHNNQRSQLSFEVDMFAEKRSVKITEQNATFILTHREITADNNFCFKDYDNKVVEDYKQHFSEFDEVLDFFVAARFAPNRKKAYLWIHADSDWGKGFFKSILSTLKLEVELSVKEVEGIFEGKPAGRHPDDFRRAFVTLFDEFKTVKSEIKQLEDKISLSPKFELTSQVQLFAKLFFSAENVGSLLNEHVEDQMANRFAYIHKSGVIDDRPLFQEIGSSVYLRHLVGYTMHRMNKKIEEYKTKGRINAELMADTYLKEFHNKYGIDKQAPRISESLDDMAGMFLNFLHENGKASYDQRYDIGIQSDYFYAKDTGGLCVKKINSILNGWLKDNLDYSALATWDRKKMDIIQRITAENKTKTKPRDANGKEHRAIRVKDI